MRLINVAYQYKYSNDPEEWNSDTAVVVAGEDTKVALQKFEEKVRAETLAPDDDHETEITVIDYRLISADLLYNKVDFISPDVVLGEAIFHGIITLDQIEDEHGTDDAPTVELNVDPEPALVV